MCMLAIKKISRRLSLFIAAVCVSLFTEKAFSQSEKHVEEGILRLKVSEELAAQLEQKKFTKSLNGDVVTGIESLDNVHKQFKVKRFERVFRDGGKFEAKHKKYGLHLWYEVSMDKRSSVSQAIQSYKNNKHVHKAEPIYKKTLRTGYPIRVSPNAKAVSEMATLSNGSNDPMFSSQWHYYNTGQTGGKPGADIGLRNAWTINTGRSDIIVSVHDEGVQVDHEDLAKNIWNNQEEISDNNIDDDGNGFVDDVHGYSFVSNNGAIQAGDHGTHVAGTISAVTNNSIGVAGIAGGGGIGGAGVKIMSCAVFSDFDANGFAESYVYAADNGAIISQNSWGYTYPGIYEGSVLDAIDYFIAEAGKDERGNQTGKLYGGLVIFAAGNDGSNDEFYPGYYEPVLTVASTTHNDFVAYYSNHGAWVDVSAPGGETDVNEQEGVLSTLSGNSYGYFMGTSMACPHASGVAALIVSRYTSIGFTPDMVKQRMKQTADKIDALNPGYEGLLGAGRINAFKALSNNDATPPPAITNLSVKAVASGQVTLQWTVPKDAATFVKGYDLRYSTSPITSSNFGTAKKAATSQASAPGTLETATVTGLVGGTQFYFAIKSVDFEENVSTISNVVSQLSAPTPLVTFTPASLSQNLKTAQTAKRTFTIANTGHATLNFTITPPTGSFVASVSPTSGVVSQGGSKTITITFDANNRFAGTYHQNISIATNDPEKQNVSYPITMVVENNNTPIVVVDPDSLLFKSVQLSKSLKKSFVIHNSGSNALTVSKVVSNNANFIVHGGASPFTIEPFKDKIMFVSFQPKATGIVSGAITVHSNDPAKPQLNVFVNGEGLNVSPIVFTPNPVIVSVEKGNTSSRSFTITNNGSFERSYSLDWINHGSDLPARSSEPAPTDSARIKFLAKRKEMFAQMKKNPGATSASFAAIPVPASIGGSPKYPNDTLRYITDFENFTTGSVDGQNSWTAGKGWTIETTNPYSGTLHLQGANTGRNSYAFAPPLNWAPWWGDYADPFPRFTYASMKINADNAAGATWTLIFQDDAFLITQVQFLPDGTIQALSVVDYESYWYTLPVTAPSGYFEFAIETDSYGSEDSGFPGFRIFINQEEVFSGYHLGIGIVQMVLAAEMENAGPSISIDDFASAGDEYIPQWVDFRPTSGKLPPHQSTTITMDVNTTDMRYGVYESDINVKVDDELLKVPAQLTVSGPLAYQHPEVVEIAAYPDSESQRTFTITNTGGAPINFDLSNDLQGLTLSPKTGTIPIRGAQVITLTIDGNVLKPDIYDTNIKMSIAVAGGVEEKQIAVNLTIWEPRAELIVVAPRSPWGNGGVWDVDIVEGETVTVAIPMYNKGEGEISYRVNYHEADFVSFFPAKGKISQDTTYWILTVDGTRMSRTSTQLFLQTNDPDHPWFGDMVLVFHVIDDPRREKITREEWANVPGKSVADIPLSKPPTTSGYITDFRAPTNKADNYGARVRGYYWTNQDTTLTFWITSDDASELWLSTDKSPANKRKIAYVDGYTNRDQRTRYPSQRSVPISLKKNQFYYIEALHKESTGGDHLTVWQSHESVGYADIVPSWNLLPIDWVNEDPQITITSPRDSDVLPERAQFKITASATDTEQRIAKVEFYVGETKVFEDVTAPYEYVSDGLNSGSYKITAVVMDTYTQTDSASITVRVDAGFCAGSGKIQREVWTNISGKLISSIPVNTPPSSIEDLQIFESPANVGDNFGARIRGYVCVPQTGNYSFWISGDDNCELWLSTSEDANAKVKIASVTGYTLKRQWDKYASQKSALIHLEAGRKYYIEALHKEATGGDHVAVGWQLPDGTFERPIGGNRIIPFHVNQKPVVKILTPASGETFTTPATIIISADASDNDGTISKVEFYANNLKIGEDANSPYSFEWKNVVSGSYTLKARATDNTGAPTTTQPTTIVVMDQCSAKGSITREYWANVSGTSVSTIPVSTTPTSVSTLTIFESPSNVGDSYGARIRGYICVPATGAYTFWISSDDNGELRLSSDDNPNNKTKIAEVTGYTNRRQWDRYASQKSAAINLVAGHSYYIEALHKEAAGGDHLAVGWTLPDGTLERPIAGSRLSPFTSSVASEFMSTSEMTDANDDFNAITLHPNPAKKSTVTLTVTGDINTREVQVTMTNVMTGKIVYSEVLPSQEGIAKVDLHDGSLTPGIYMVSAMVDRKRFLKRLIVE